MKTLLALFTFYLCLGTIVGCGGKYPAETKSEMLHRVYKEQNALFYYYETKSTDFLLKSEMDSAQMYGDSAKMADYAADLIFNETYP